MATGIYKITNKITGDFYIGQSTNIKTRFSQHRSLNKTPKSELNKAIAKYGKGHKVSEGTRKKISEKVSNKVGNQVMIVETGEVFKQVRLLEKKLGACTGTVNAYWSGKIKTVKGYHVVKV